MKTKEYKPFKFESVTIAGLKFKQVDYHRNGVSGYGFYCAVANDKKYGDMLITYFLEAENGTCCAVYKLDLLPDITFGINSWRGDSYAGVMQEAIKEYNQQFDKYLELDDTESK